MIDRRQVVATLVVVILALASPRAARCESARRAHRRADEAGRLVARAAKHLARAPLTADETAHLIATHRTSPEGQEGLRAFLEKRKANWSP